MKQANKIKKAEKKILIFIVTIFSIIKKVLVSFVKFFLNAGNQKITIMFIPHSEKKVFNFRINVFLLFCIFFIVFSGVFVIGFLSLKNSDTLRRYSDVNKDMLFNQKRSLAYEEMINEIIENHTIFKSKQDLLLSQLDSPKIKAMRERDEFGLGHGGPLTLKDTAALSEFDIQRNEVDKLLNDYKYSMQAFGEMNKMANRYNKILKDLPFGNPVKGPSIFTSGFGFRIHPIHKVLDMHQGIDLAYSPGTKIVATAPGIVEKVEWNPFGYGWYCKISHKLGFSTLYAHLRSQPVVRPGDKVRKGQLIGYMGKTGATTGVHVHYEVRLGDNLMDPWRFVSNY